MCGKSDVFQAAGDGVALMCCFRVCILNFPISSGKDACILAIFFFFFFFAFAFAFAEYSFFNFVWLRVFPLLSLW